MTKKPSKPCQSEPSPLDTDTKRLDFLERTEGEPPYRLVDGGWWWCYNADPARTLRSAIDKQRRAAREKKPWK